MEICKENFLNICFSILLSLPIMMTDFPGQFCLFWGGFHKNKMSGMWGGRLKSSVLPVCPHPKHMALD